MSVWKTDLGNVLTPTSWTEVVAGPAPLPGPGRSALMGQVTGALPPPQLPDKEITQLSQVLKPKFPFPAQV